MARIDWQNITFSGKELALWGSMCFAVCGIYYKDQVTDVKKEREFSLKVQRITYQVDSVKGVVNYLEKQDIAKTQQIRILQDNDLKRSTIESSNGYLQLNKK